MSGDTSSEANVRCQGCRAECSILKASILVSVEAWRGKVYVRQGVNMLSPDIFDPQKGGQQSVSHYRSNPTFSKYYVVHLQR